MPALAKPLDPIAAINRRWGALSCITFVITNTNNNLKAGIPFMISFILECPALLVPSLRMLSQTEPVS